MRYHGRLVQVTGNFDSPRQTRAGTAREQEVALFLRLSQNASTGNDGTCFGDSGGPDFFRLTVNRLSTSRFQSSASVIELMPHRHEVGGLASAAFTVP
jgi:hypothetical protein